MILIKIQIKKLMQTKKIIKKIFELKLQRINENK